MENSTPSPSNHENENKCEQMMLEALQQMCEIIVQSRIDVDQPTKENQKTNTKFNLVLKEVENVRDKLGRIWSAPCPAVQQPLKRPIQLDIFWQDLSLRDPLPPKVLVERWELQYNWTGGNALGPGSYRRFHAQSHQAPTSPPQQPSAPLRAGSGGSSASAPHTSVLAQLRRVYRRITAVLRTLYSCTRMLPAYQLYRRASSGTTNSRERLGFVLCRADGLVREETGGMLSFDHQLNADDAVIETHITSVNTPYGEFHLNLRYRQNVDFQVTRPQELIGSNLIIQDYASYPRKKDSFSSPDNQRRSPSRRRPQNLSDQPRIRSYSVHDGSMMARHHGGRLMTRPMGIPGASKSVKSRGHLFDGPRTAEPRMFWDLSSNINQENTSSPERRGMPIPMRNSPRENPMLAPFRVYSRSADSYSPLQRHMMGSPQIHSKSQHSLWSAVPYGAETKSRYHYQSKNSAEEGSLESPLSRKSSLDRKASFESSGYGDRRRSSHGPFESSGDESYLPPATPPFTYAVAQAGKMRDSFNKPFFSSSPPFTSIPLHLAGTSQLEPPPLTLPSSLQRHSSVRSPENAGLALLPLPDSPFQSLDHSSLLQNSVFKDTCGVSHMTASSSVQETQDSQKQDTQSQDLPFSTSDSIDDLDMTSSSLYNLPKKESDSASLQQLLKLCESLEGQEFADCSISLNSLEKELAEFQHYHDEGLKKILS